MAHKMRRTFGKKKVQEFVIQWVKNPAFDINEAKKHAQNGYEYPVPEFIEEERPVWVTKRTSHIEYQIICQYCKSKGWVRRKDAKFCSAGCRRLNHNLTKTKK